MLRKVSLILIAFAVASNAKSVRPKAPRVLSPAEALMAFSPDERIINGENANKGEFPYMVSIKDSRSTGEYIHFCGGVIINELHILTSAGCFYQQHDILPYLEVVAGENDQVLVNEDSEQRMSVQIFYIHEDFKPFTFENNLAIVRLNEPLTLNDAVAKAKLPTNDNEDPSVSEGLAIGWGITEQGQDVPSRYLQKLALDMISDDECRKISASLTDSMICYQGSGSPCERDLGGPLVSDGTVVGIISHGAGNACDDQNPQIFTQVSYYLPWIEELTQT